MLWVSALAAFVIVLLAILVRINRDNDDTQSAAPTTTSTAAPSPLTPPCGAVTTTDDQNIAIPDAVLTQVTAVHDAACRRDYDQLLTMMDTPFGDRQPAEALVELRANDGAPLTILTQTLEVNPIIGQGGLVYCHPHGAVAVFARGTLSRPGMWTDFSLVSNTTAADDCLRACWQRV